MTAVKVENLSKSYKKVKALESINLEIREGEIFGLIGPDGAGKSTLMKIIAGILSFDRGSVKVFGVDVKREAEKVKEILSFMPQGIGQNLYMDLTVEENIDFYAKLRQRVGEDYETFKKRLLETAGLYRFRGRMARHLSGGMQQKLGICCALVAKPRLLMLDEPTTGVDPLSRRELWDMLFEFSREGVTMIISTSYMTEAERCYRVALMDGGRVIAELDTDEVVRSGKGFDEIFKEFSSKGEEFKIVLPKLEKREGIEVGIINVTKKFGNFTAVNNVTFEVNKGEIFGILGPNGAGKTTIIKMMVGLLKPTKGKILMPDKRKIGYMSQKFSLYKDLTVEENIDYYASLHNLARKEKEGRKRWILEISGLEKYKREIVQKLPLGFKQRLALGCSFIHFPQVLFLDEPTSGVDPVGREEFWKLIFSLSRELKTTILVTTHHLVEAHYCDRLILMNFGKIIASGTPEELINKALSAQGKIYEIKVGDPFKIRNILKKHGYYTYLYGRRVRAWTHKKLPEIESLLKQKIVIEEKKPSMEDVFVLFASQTAVVGCS